MWKSHRVAGRLTAPSTLLAIGGIVVIVALYGSVTASNPPGFYRDEASLSLNAASIADSGRDEYGGRFPLFLKSFGDYKSPAWVYATAAAFAVTRTTTVQVARGVSALFGLLALLTIGLIGWRLTGRIAVGVVAGVLAGLVPWLFEVTRLAFEVSSTPFAFALVLLCALEGSRRDRWPLWLSLATGLSLSFLAYSYQTGRLYAPLLAVALVLLVTRSRLRGLAVAWGVFALTTVLPLLAFVLRHPGALSARYATTTYLSSSMSAGEIARRFTNKYWRVLDLWHWTTGGDTNPRHHVQGVGTLLLAVAILAAAGAVIVVARHRRERFWWFFLAAFLVVPVPASLVYGYYHALRWVALPVCLCVLAIPAIDVLLRQGSSSRLAQAAVVVLVVLAIGQTAWFQTTYWRHGADGDRAEAFESGAETAVRVAFLSAPTGVVYAYADEPRGRTQLQWWSRVLGEKGNVAILPAGGTPPPGSIVFVDGFPTCPGCTSIIERSGYAAYRVP